MRRSLTLAAGAFYLVLNAFVWLALPPPPAVACSCAQVSIGDMNGPENQVFVATAGVLGPGGQPVAVERWLHGTGAAPVVVLARGSFGQGGGADCTIPPLPEGTNWILSTWLEAPGAQPRVGLCNPLAQLDSPEGQAMLGAAVAAFGAGFTPPPLDPGGAPPTSPDPVALTLLIGGVALGVIGVGGLVVWARRRA